MIIHYISDLLCLTYSYIFKSQSVYSLHQTFSVLKLLPGLKWTCRESLIFCFVFPYNISCAKNLQTFYEIFCKYTYRRHDLKNLSLRILPLRLNFVQQCSSMIVCLFLMNLPKKARVQICHSLSHFSGPF